MPNRPYTHHHNHHRQHYVYVTHGLYKIVLFSTHKPIFSRIYIFTVYSSPLSSITLSYFYFMSLLPPSCLPFTLLYSLLIFVHVFQSQALCTSHSSIPLCICTKKASLFSLLSLHTFPIKILFSTYRIKKHICISFFFSYLLTFFFLFSFTFYGPFISACATATPLKLLWGFSIHRIYKKGWSFLHKGIFPAIHFHIIIIKYVSRFL